ncbi:PqqD family protein, partial [bacterium]|nr:PqqD family protein [bacterium]
TGLFFGLDAMGTRVWNLLAEHGDPRRAVETLLEEFDVDRARLERDVEELVAALLAHGLLSHGE